MKVLGYILIIVGIFFGFLGLGIAMKPSVMPLATVAGALVIPALLIWWGLTLVKKKQLEK